MINNILNFNTQNFLKCSNNRNFIAVKAFFIIAIIILSIFIIITILQKAYAITSLDIILLFLCFLGLYLLKKDYDIDKLAIFATILLFSSSLVILFIRNGIEYTLIWSFIFPFVAMVLNGVKKGFYFSILFYAINFILVYTFIGESITPAAYIRFVSISILFTVIAFFYEYTTQNALDMLKKSIQCKEDLNIKLEEKIKKELKKSKNKDSILFEQSKHAAMGEMIGNISHQWRQPLSIISTGATGMKMHKEYGLLTDEVFEKTCLEINNNAQYLSKTIDDFKNFIKGDREKINFNLIEDINSFIILVKGAIKNNNINLILDVQDNINIHGYPNELIQCFINIFNNSKDAFQENNIKNEFIFITTLVQNKQVQIKIKDNAGGIPLDVLPRIFEPYFTTKHQSKGTGIGLHMTHNLIVNGMDGTIQANNVNYDYNGVKYVGAEFTITLSLL